MSAPRNQPPRFETLEPRLLLSGSMGMPDALAAVAGPADHRLGAARLRADDYGGAFDSAATVRLRASSATLVRGVINGEWDVDVFGLRAEQDGVARLDPWVGGRGVGRFQLSCFDSQGRLLDSTGGIGGADGALEFDVLRGQTYYLRMAPAGQGANNFRYVLTARLSRKVKPAPPAPSPSPTPTPTPAPAPSPSPAPVQPGASVTAQVVSDGSTSQLLIAGTDAADSVLVRKDAGGLVVVSAAGTMTFAQSVSSIVIYGFAGGDTIRMDNSVTLADSIYAGDGDDAVYDAGKGAGTVWGGAGADLLITIGGGADALYGQDGLDSYWLDSTDTLYDASAEENAAASVHKISQFYQPYSSDPASGLYVSLEIAGQNLADPAITGGAVGYGNFAGRALFVNGPNYNDIVQGGVGDCYFLGALSSLADQDAMVIRQMITPLGDGTFAVRFYKSGQATYLRVDADLPVNAYGGTAFAALGRDGELWVALAEKAYAYFRYAQNSYASLNGGWMGDVYQHVTNTAAQYRSTNGLTAADLYAYLANNLQAGHAVSLGSNSNASGPIAGSHAYMVKSVSGGQYVTVYNTWGVDGSSTDDNYYDGLITLTAGDVLKYFFAVAVCMV